MLTRLKVSGFKNLLDLDIRFGPFTCIFGPNGVGKSNLFDAIHFLSLLADRPLMDAAAAVRDAGRRSRSMLGLFYRSGDYVCGQIDFEMDLLVPLEAVDDFGQTAKATITTLRYELSIGIGNQDQLILKKEQLRHISLAEARSELGRFGPSVEWKDSVIKGSRRAPYFISTNEEKATVRIHQDSHAGRPVSYRADALQRTVVSGSNSAENPTILVLRREMQSWLQLQLEPSSLRKPDEVTASPHLSASGEHMPATLERLIRKDKDLQTSLANRLAELIGDVRDVYAERDTSRDLITAYARFADGTAHPASSLSDGTLRFLALAVLEQDTEFRGLLCLEEPENGIHPERIPAMIRLLTDLAMDTDLPAGSDNPLRQVIINTHSPVCAAEVPPDSLLSDETAIIEREGQLLRTIQLKPMSQTWRTKVGGPSISTGRLVEYLRPVRGTNSQRGHRVADRPELQMELVFPDEG